MMCFVELLKQPWFAISPSPWSFAFYILMGIIGARKLRAAYHDTTRHNTAKRNAALWILRFIDAIFLLGLIVFLQDTIWLCVNTARWIIPMYSGIATFWNYYVRFPQNLLGFLFLTLLSYGNFARKVASFNWKTLYYLLIIALFTSAVFALAPNQGWTDWVLAVHTGYSDQVILGSFLISHVGYKFFIGMAFLSLFDIEDNSINLNKKLTTKEDSNLESKSNGHH